MSSSPIYYHVPYLKGVINPKDRKKKIERIIKMLKPYNDRFTTFAFMGMSGALIAPLLADKMGKDILLVRKNDKSHSYYNAEGRVDGDYVIIDDLVDSGKTVRKIIDDISKVYPIKCVALVLYDNYFTIEETKSKIQHDIPLLTIQQN